MKSYSKRVLVTGSGGFIGSHLVEAISKKSFAIQAFVHYNSFNRWGWLDYLPKDLKDRIEVFTGDIRDPNGVREAMKNCSIVFHLAALIGIPYSYHSPDTYVDTNIKGTLNVLQAARDLGIERVIHTSTSEVYGTAQYVPIDEQHPLQAQSPYAATKIAADQLALSFYRSFGTPVTVVRPFNTYGPRQSARAIIPTIISQILSGKDKISIGSIHPKRDLNYVKDTVNGFLAAAESDNAIGEIINIGSNFEISIGDLAILIADVMDRKIDIVSEEARVRPKNSEVDRLLASNEKARSILGWSPEFSGLEGLRKGIRETVSWFSDKNNLSFYKSDIYNI
ncbi:MAG: NAD-dependent 4,6-dehydratase LegB [Candidatus Xenobiia bacterium LiM19]